MIEDSTRSPRYPRRGAVRDLGLEIEWQTCFVGAGTSARTQRDAVYLDVGGRLEPGVLDHHQEAGGGGTRSTARLVLEQPHLVYEHLMERWHGDEEDCGPRGGRWMPTIVLHQRPDLDAMVSTWMTRRLVEDGGLEPAAHSLAALADTIDQGEFELEEDSGASLLGLLATIEDLQDEELDELLGPGDPEIADERRLELGVSVVASWAGLFDGKSAEELGSDPYGWHLDLSGIVIESRHAPGRSVQMRAIGSLYDSRVRAFKVAMESHAEQIAWFSTRVPYSVPPTAAETVEVGGVVLPSEVVASTRLALYFVRNGLGADPGSPDSKKAPDLVIEDRGITRQKLPDSKARHFVVSIRPQVIRDGDARRPTLRGLGLKLERLEQENRQGVESLELERRGLMRFEEFPDISDPWYDGRGHGHTIVDSPRVGSVLCLEDIIGEVKSAYWEPEISDLDLACLLGRHDDADTMRDRIEKVESGGLAATLRRWFRQHLPERGDVLGVMQMRVHPAWDVRSIDDELNRFVGGRDMEREIEGSTYIFGRRGVVCLTPRDRPGHSFDELLEQAKPIWDMQQAVLDVSERAARLDDKGGEGIERLVDDFVRRLSDYRLALRRPIGARSSIQGSLVGSIDLESQIEATDRLLEHLDDKSERDLNRRLNVILILVGGLALFEVGAALNSHFEDEGQGYGFWASTGLDEFVWVGMLGFTVLILSASVVVTRSKTWSRRVERLFGLRR